jgi:ParB family chromosome partitioning protein
MNKTKLEHMTADHKRKALGRGLGALLNVDENVENSIFPQINIDLIDTNPYQPRNTFEDEKLLELSESIKHLGVIQPITVRKLENGRYQLISGERRLRAAKLAGLTSIPAFIRDASETEILQLALVENIQREDLNAIDVAIALEKLIEEYNLTQEQLSEKIGKNRATIANFLRLLKLPVEVQAAIREGKISMGHARALINLPSIELQLEITEKIIQNDLSVRQVEELVRKLQEKKDKKIVKEDAPLPPSLKRIQDVIESQGLKLKIKHQKRKGSITIHYKNEKELDKILALLHIHED